MLTLKGRRGTEETAPPPARDVAVSLENRIAFLRGVGAGVEVKAPSVQSTDSRPSTDGTEAEPAVASTSVEQPPAIPDHTPTVTVPQGTETGSQLPVQEREMENISVRDAVIDAAKNLDEGQLWFYSAEILEAVQARAGAEVNAHTIGQACRHLVEDGLFQQEKRGAKNVYRLSAKGSRSASQAQATVGEQPSDMLTTVLGILGVGDTANNLTSAIQGIAEHLRRVPPQYREQVLNAAKALAQK